MFTGSKIVMHIRDAEIDLETMRPQMAREAEAHKKYSVEMLESSQEASKGVVK